MPTLYKVGTVYVDLMGALVKTGAYYKDTNLPPGKQDRRDGVEITLLSGEVYTLNAADGAALVAQLKSTATDVYARPLSSVPQTPGKGSTPSSTAPASK